MGSAATVPSKSLGRLLRSRRAGMNLTLAQVSDRLAAEGHRIPISTLALIESGRHDPGVLRLHRLLRVYAVPPHLVADLIEMEDLAGEVPRSTDLESLHREGREHWEKGEIGRALACWIAVREHSPSDEGARLTRQKALVSFAVGARAFGKVQLAREILGEVLCEPPDASIRVSVLVLAAQVWRHLGAPDAARAFLREAEATDPVDARQEAWVAHEKAAMLLASGRLDEAERDLERAIAAYRREDDTHGEALARASLVSLLERRGELERAAEAADEAARFATEHGHEQTAVALCIHRGALLVRSGRHREGIALLREGLGHAVVAGDPHGQFVAHYHLWKAHESLGDRERARFESEAAIHFVRFVDVHSPEAEEARALSSKRGKHDRG